MWLLLVITLNIAPAKGDIPHVVHAEIAEIVDTEKNCVKKQKYIIEEGNKRNKPLPRNVNLGCVPLNGKKT